MRLVGETSDLYSLARPCACRRALSSVYLPVLLPLSFYLPSFLATIFPTILRSTQITGKKGGELLVAGTELGWSRLLSHQIRLTRIRPDENSLDSDRKSRSGLSLDHVTSD